MSGRPLYRDRRLTVQDLWETVEVRYPPHTRAAQAVGRLLTEQYLGDRLLTVVV